MLLLVTLMISILLLDCHAVRDDTNSPTPNSSSLMTVEIITNTFFKPIIFGAYNFIGPAYETALKELNVKYEGRLNFTQHLIYDQTLKMGECTEWGQESDNQVAKYYFRERDPEMLAKPHVTVFVLAACADLDGVSRFGSGVNDVVISTSLSSPFMKDKINFPTLLSTGLWPPSVYVALYLELFRTYSWTNIVFLLDLASNVFYYMVALNMAAAVKAKDAQMDGVNYNIDVINVMMNRTVDSVDSQLTAAFRQFKGISRVMAVFADAPRLLRLMRHAHSLNMTDGSYVYILAPPTSSRYFQSAIPKMLQLPENEMLQDSLRSCLFVTVDDKEFNFGLPEGQVHPFVPQWKNRSLALNYTYKPNEEVPPNALSAYAAMMSLGQVVGDLVEHNLTFNFSDGAALARQFFNRSFSTAAGTIGFNAIGERVPTTFISYFDHINSTLRVALIRDSRVQKLVKLEEPNWPGPWPVPNRPYCGYRGDSIPCLPYDSSLRDAILSAGAAAIFLLVLILLVYLRKIRSGNALAQQWWCLTSSLLRSSIEGRTLTKILQTQVFASKTGNINTPLSDQRHH